MEISSTKSKQSDVRIMKILLLADPGSIHTEKWVKSLCEHGVTIYLFGLSSYKENDYYGINNLIVESFEITNKLRNKSKNGSFQKFKYLRVIPRLKSIIKSFQPDLVHSHYASSYGFLGALLNFHPFIVSVWGEDIYSFPKISYLHKKIIEFNLRKADRILSTSHVMAVETAKYTKKKIEITPFGIDVNVFFNDRKSNPSQLPIVIGTVKSLEKKYGIDYLIKSFKIVLKNNPTIPLKLLIAGEGTEYKNLLDLVKDLNLEEFVFFSGKIPHSEVPIFLNTLDIYSALSILDSESFGVAIVEASSCELPVLVSNVGGLPEVVDDKITGFIVPPKDEKSAAAILSKLILDKDLRITLGKNGREKVQKKYKWEDNVKTMLSIYDSLINDEIKN